MESLYEFYRMSPSLFYKNLSTPLHIYIERGKCYAPGHITNITVLLLGYGGPMGFHYLMTNLSYNLTSPIRSEWGCLIVIYEKIILTHLVVIS